MLTRIIIKAFSCCILLIINSGLPKFIFLLPSAHKWSINSIQVSLHFHVFNILKKLKWLFFFFSSFFIHGRVFLKDSGLDSLAKMGSESLSKALIFRIQEYFFLYGVSLLTHKTLLKYRIHSAHWVWFYQNYSSTHVLPSTFYYLVNKSGDFFHH